MTSPVELLDQFLALVGPAVIRERDAGDAIVVEMLEKTYPNGTRAVRGISFRVGRGEFYGIIGPNGAGKSTTIGILGTLVKPTGGRAVVDGFDVAAHPREVRARIGFAMQEVGVDEVATGQEYLLLQGRLEGLSRAEAGERADALLRLVGLEHVAGDRIKHYSGGMKRRVDLASVLIHMPPILFLDEPTEGLDPQNRVILWEILRALNRQTGTTVVLTTHYMDEADRLCDRIGIIDEGRLVVEGTPEELKASLEGDSLLLRYGPESPPEVLVRCSEILAGLASVHRVVPGDGDIAVQVEDATEAAPEVLRVLDRRGVAPRTLSIMQPTLEDVYLRYAGRTFARAEAAEGEGEERQ